MREGFRIERERPRIDVDERGHVAGTHHGRRRGHRGVGGYGDERGGEQGQRSQAQFQGIRSVRQADCGRGAEPCGKLSLEPVDARSEDVPSTVESRTDGILEFTRPGSIEGRRIGGEDAGPFRSSTRPRVRHTTPSVRDSMQSSE